MTDDERVTFAGGTIPITMTARDAAGNATTRTANVTLAKCEIIT